MLLLGNMSDNKTNGETLPSENDFFAEMFSDSVLLQATVATFLIGTVLSLISMSGLIWYERYGNHRYRTVINQLFSTLSWIVVWYLLLVYIPEGTRYMIGPLNETFCELHNLLKNALICSFLVTLDCISLLRHAFIFNWKHFAVVNDDLMARFVNGTISVLGLWMALVKRLSFGSMHIHYFLCAGKNPNERNGREVMGTNFNTTKILTCISVVLHVFVSTKTFLYQRKLEKRTEKIRLGLIHPSQPNSDNHLSEQNNVIEAWPDNSINNRGVGGGIISFSKSMIDFTTQILCMMFFVMVSLIQLILLSLEPKDLNEYKNRWYAYFIQIIALPIAIAGISLIYYSRNIVVSKAIWRRIKEQFQ